MITGATRLAGVIGWPVSHSRSPLLHNHWLARYGIDGAYVPLPVRPGALADALAGLRAAGFAGANVTIPHKEAAFALCGEMDAAAQASGAVNTLFFSDTGVAGSNTDGAGFLANLRAHGVAAHGVAAQGPALLLGAGGAARAIAAALLGAGVQVSVANRSAERALALRAALHASGSVAVIGWDRRSAALADHALLVNTTSLGMHGAPMLEIDLAGAPRSLVVADIVYVPLETALLAQARARGLRVVPGLGMLLHQAAQGFAGWFGRLPEVDAACHDLLAADLA